jgi:hypothetical protein
VNYLRSPRIHFAGKFQADVSTVNNDVRHFANAQFRDEFQQLMEVQGDKITKYNGYWNPQGTGAWRLLGCRVTAAVLDGRVLTRPEDDPVVGCVVGDAADLVAGKLVDLDPQQQMVSQIWGLSVGVVDGRGVTAFRGDFAVTAFCDLWLRQQTEQFFEQQLAAAYQSVLTGVRWPDLLNSPCLRALKALGSNGLLSIRLNVFGYERSPTAADYGTGVVVGTIGPAAANEPRHFVAGRHLTAALTQSGFPFVPANQVANLQAEWDEATQTVHVDFGNALPIANAAGVLEDIGPLAVGVVRNADAKQGDTVTADQVEILGPVPYRNDGWYVTTAGIQDFPLGGNAAATALLPDHPLAVLLQGQTGQYTVLNRETAGGVYARADVFVFRLNPGDSAKIDFYARKYGRPLATTLTAQPTEGFMGGPGTGADIPNIPVPDVNTPAGVLQFHPSFETGPDGRGSLTVTAAAQGPGNPRQYLDGQVYGIAYQIKDLPDNYNANPFDYISILAWDRFDVPDQPTWYQHIRPILTQYGNLYPIMSRRLVNLGDYASVVGNLPLMKLSLSLPADDPNSMPVTRDMSAAKRETLLNWLDARDPSTGLPPLGQPPAPAASAAGPAAEAAGAEPDVSSKVEFLRQALRHRRR